MNIEVMTQILNQELIINQDINQAIKSSIPISNSFFQEENKSENLTN